MIKTKSDLAKLSAGSLTTIFKEIVLNESVHLANSYRSLKNNLNITLTKHIYITPTVNIYSLS